MKKLKNNQKGTLFWITGLSGSGKTTIAEKIKKNIALKYGPTLTISGDDLRKLFNYNKFSRRHRLIYALSYGKFCEYITNKNINIIFSTVSLFHKVRSWNKSNINNYVEIYIKTDIRDVMKKKKKFFYKGNYKNIVGKNLKAEFPKSPDIIIQNNFKKTTNRLSKELLKKILLLS
jgi:adenylylsulfate kinase-like enzyme